MGKGGGALSAWLKEFTALVFTQTIQAFIYAIIICIILYGMGNNSGVSANDNNSALGLMATFALLSVFKVEELTKKIFGIGDTKASHKGAIKSLAHTAIAAKLGSRVLNNAGKVFGGIKAVNKAGQDRRKAQKRLNEDMQDNGFEMQNGKPVYVGNKNKSRTSTSASGGAGGTSGTNDAQEHELDVAVRNSEKAAVAGGGGSSSGSDVISDAARRRMKNAVRTYEDKLDEINKARDEGWKSIASGFAESTGALIGGTAGGILRGADGDIGEMLQGIAAGAGAGDIVGKNAIEGLDRAVKFAQRNAKRQAGVSTKEFKETIDGYKKAIESLDTKYGINDVSDI